MKYTNIHKHVFCRWECNNFQCISLEYDDEGHISVIISRLVHNSLKTSCSFLCLPCIFHKRENWSEWGWHTLETISSFRNSFPNERYNWSYRSLAPTTQWGFSLAVQLQNLLANISLILPHSLQELRWVRMSCYSCFFTDSIPCQNICDGFEHFIIQISLSFHLVTFFYNFSDLDMNVFWIGALLMGWSRNCVISQSQ